MSLLDKLLKKTAQPEDIDRLLAESVRDLVKARHGKRDEEEEFEEKEKARAKKREPEEFEDEEEEEEKAERARKSRSKKAKKDVKPLFGDDEDEGIDEDEIDYEEPEDEADEEAEEEAAGRQKRVAKRSQKSRAKKAKANEEKDIQDTIDEDQEDVYFDEDEDEDLPGEEYEIPEEEGHERGIITNYGRRIRDGKAKKSLYVDPMEDVAELLGNVALLLDASLKRQDKLTKAVAVMMKSLQKINGDMELVKSQTPGYPMPAMMYAPPARKNEAKKEAYRPEQVREALIKGMSSGQVSAELLRDFDAWVGRPGASIAEWVNDSLDDSLRKALGL